MDSSDSASSSQSDSYLHSDTQYEQGDPVAAANVTNHLEPVATEPLERVDDEKDLNVETQLDYDYAAATEGYGDEYGDITANLRRPVSQKALADAATTEDYEDEYGDNKADIRWPFRKQAQANTEEKPQLARTQSSVTTSSSLAPSELSRAPSKQDLIRQDHRWYHYLLFKRKHLPPIPTERTHSPEHETGLFGLVTWQWMAPLMAKGYQRPLELNDVWTVNPSRSATVLAERLKRNFEVRRNDPKTKKILLWAMFDTFRFEFLLGGACQLLASVVQVINPFILRYLITFASEAYIAAKDPNIQPPNVGRGIGLVFAVTILQFIQSSSTNQFLYRGMINGGQARAVLISVIFDKSMTISGRAKAGGKAIDTPPPDVKPGSKEEEKWFRKILGGDDEKKRKRKFPFMKGKSGVSGDGQGWSNGRILNLMSTDSYRIDQASGMFHMTWTSPIAIIITLVLLLININYSALAGFGLFCISMPVLTHAIKSLFRRRKAISRITDQRVGLTQEILQAIRFVKLFGWEESFLERIGNLRQKEIRSIQWLLSIRNGINAISMSMPVFASMLSFITYSLTAHSLNPALIFSSLALFNSLRLPLNLLPMVIGQVVDAAASAGRIQDFLLEEDAKDESDWNFDNKNAIDVVNATFTWERISEMTEGVAVSADTTLKQDKAANKAALKQEKGERKADKQKLLEEKRLSKLKTKRESDLSSDGTDNSSSSASTLAEKEEHQPFKISDLNFSVARNELVAVIGGVGSGKSSLLAALAGDMRRTAGNVSLGATRAFCPQYAWIQNATVQENILFGKDMDKTWYNEVIDACALRPDLDMLPAGDQTEIGERGITVSGGQKQRLNIARAVYFDSDMVLMDDPLSAVDAHVGRHIMDAAICGLLQNKCRILATHQLWVLSRCDRIIWMEEGRITAFDTFENLMANNADFRTLIANNAQEDEKEEEEAVNEDEVEGEKKQMKKRRGKKPAAALMQAEERAVSSVSSGVYKAYVKASGSVFFAPAIIILLILSQGSTIATSLWLSWWTGNTYGYTKGTYIGVYAALGALSAMIMFAFSVLLSVAGTNSSRTMLDRALTRVLRAPMSFFDTTPLGRITNRFSKDIDTMDNVLSDSFRFFFITMGMIISVFILIIAYYYYFAIALGPLFVLFVAAAGFYRASAREVKRHESVLRSHVFAKFSEAVVGTATIRAYGLGPRFSKTIRDAIDDMNSAYFLTFSNQRWLSVRLDAIGNLLVFTVGILVVTSRFSVSPSTGGLVLSYILSIVQMIQFTVRQLAEVENNMNSTERIHYYGTELEEEAPARITGREVPKEWPQRGEIEFSDVQMRYRAGLPLVLQEFSLHVQPGERIGIVGRTGAGKSSIMSTLFRLVELSGGSIKIDGIDISTIGLADLRSKLAIIPQDPTLFKGTIRSNLDPFNKYDDLVLWSALRQADLVGEEIPTKSKKGGKTDASSPVNKEVSVGDEKDEKHTTESPLEKETGKVANQGSGAGRIHLDSAVEEEGLNFSLGQRQLMALARALVRNAQIIVCDEATSSVDMLTDLKIQRTMAAGFEGRTVLCIAHRLKTILGYDRIVVMDKGRVSEVGSPWQLWERGGAFRSMCARSNIQEVDFENKH